MGLFILAWSGVFNLQWENSCDCEQGYDIGRVGITTFGDTMSKLFEENFGFFTKEFMMETINRMKCCYGWNYIHMEPRENQ